MKKDRSFRFIYTKMSRRNAKLFADCTVVLLLKFPSRNLSFLLQTYMQIDFNRISCKLSDIMIIRRLLHADQHQKSWSSWLISLAQIRAAPDMRWKTFSLRPHKNPQNLIRLQALLIKILRVASKSPVWLDVFLYSTYVFFVWNVMKMFKR